MLLSFILYNFAKLWTHTRKTHTKQRNANIGHVQEMYNSSHCHCDNHRVQQYADIKNWRNGNRRHND